MPWSPIKISLAASKFTSTFVRPECHLLEGFRPYALAGVFSTFNRTPSQPSSQSRFGDTHITVLLIKLMTIMISQLGVVAKNIVT